MSLSIILSFFCLNVLIFVDCKSVNIIWEQDYCSLDDPSRLSNNNIILPSNNTGTIICGICQGDNINLIHDQSQLVDNLYRVRTLEDFINCNATNPFNIIPTIVDHTINVQFTVSASIYSFSAPSPIFFVSTSNGTLESAQNDTTKEGECLKLAIFLQPSNSDGCNSLDYSKCNTSSILNSDNDIIGFGCQLRTTTTTTATTTTTTTTTATATTTTPTVISTNSQNMQGTTGNQTSTIMASTITTSTITTSTSMTSTIMDLIGCSENQSECPITITLLILSFFAIIIICVLIGICLKLLFPRNNAPSVRYNVKEYSVQDVTLSPVTTTTENNFNENGINYNNDNYNVNNSDNNNNDRYEKCSEPLFKSQGRDLSASSTIKETNYPSNLEKN